MNNKKESKSNNTFGKYLRELRKAKGYTQQALAEKANIDENIYAELKTVNIFPHIKL